MNDKVKQSIEYLKNFCSDTYTVLNSGGKDSAVVAELCRMADVPFKQVHNLTTVDAPETVYYIRSQGIEIIRPKLSMWQLIVKKMLPPTRLMRYCCAELKENYGAGELLVTGVRAAESRTRKDNGGLIKILDNTKKALKEFKEINEEFDKVFFQNQYGGWILNNDNEADRDIVDHCYKQHKILINPIFEWSDRDVWDFIRERKIELNPLYSQGYCRVGCIGCPMGSTPNKYKEFNQFPQYKKIYIHTFDRMIQNRLDHGKPTVWKNGEECFRWWLGENPDQLRFEDIMTIKEEMLDIHYYYEPV